MKTLAMWVLVMGCSLPAAAQCLSEADVLAQLQGQYQEVVVQDRFEGPQAQQFVALYAQAVGKAPEEFATIDLVVVFARPEGHTYKLALFSAACVAGSGHLLKDVYPDFLTKLQRASPF